MARNNEGAVMALDLRQQGIADGLELFERVYVPLFREFPGDQVVPDWRSEAASEIAGDETLNAMRRLKADHPALKLRDLRAYRLAVQTTLKAKIAGCTKRS